MRIVDPEVIQQEERSLIEGIKKLFQIDAFQQYVKSNYQFELAEISDLSGGDILVRNDKIVFAIGLSGKVAFSILLDRHGNYLGLNSSNGLADENGQTAEHQMILSSPDMIIQKEKEIVHAIAEGVSMGNIRSLFEKEFKISLSGDSRFDSGNITIFNSVPAYQLNYKSSLNVNLLIDKDGSLIELSTPESVSEANETNNIGPAAEMGGIN
jgi:hypothetical protein